MNRRQEMVRRFGDGDLVACATLQEGLSYLETSFGFWAYRRVGGVSAALGGPICDVGDRAEMLERFLRSAGRPMLFYLREPMAKIASDAGLHSAAMGCDRVLDVRTLLRTPPKETRGAMRHARAAEFEIREVEFGDFDARRLDDISAAYLANAEVDVEIAFLNRPMSHVRDGMRRLFLLERRGEVFGFAVLNPVYEQGRVASYLLDLLRFEPTRQWGIWLASVYMFASRLAGEGFGLSVGFSPLHGLAHPPGASRVLTYSLDQMERRLSSAQYLRRLYELKSLLPGGWESRSFAGYSRNVLRILHVFMEASGLGFSYLFGPDLLRVVSRGFSGDR